MWYGTILSTSEKFCDCLTHFNDVCPQPILVGFRKVTRPSSMDSYIKLESESWMQCPNVQCCCGRRKSYS